MANNVNIFWQTLGALLPKSHWADCLYAYIKFIRVHHRIPLANSMKFNDVLYRIKVSGELSNPLRTFVTDKEYFKLYVRSVASEKYIVPTLAILRSKEDVDQFNFPNAFCAKPTHMSGKVLISRDGTANKEEIKSWLDLNHYDTSREINYLFLEKKIIVEPIIFDQEDITDYRVFCYKGKARLICLDIGKYSKYRRAFYSTDWVRQNFSLGYPIYEDVLEKPANLEEIILAAEMLAQGLDFVRVDIYSNGINIYFGEMTHCHASGSQRFIPSDAESYASQLIFGSVTKNEKFST